MAHRKAKIDLAELEKLCAMQCTDEEIAAFFGVSTKTVERRPKVQRFSDVMEQATAKGRVSVRRNLGRRASTGNVAAAIFLAKNLLGYRDVVANEVSGPDGRPIPIESRPDLSNLYNEELEQLKNFSEKAQRKRRISIMATSETKLRFLLSPSMIEAELRRRRAAFVTPFPDSAPLGRESCQKHLESFAAGAQYKERLFMAANRVGKTVARAFEATCHLTGRYPHRTGGRAVGSITPRTAGPVAPTARPRADVVHFVWCDEEPPWTSTRRFSTGCSRPRGSPGPHSHRCWA